MNYNVNTKTTKYTAHTKHTSPPSWINLFKTVTSAASYALNSLVKLVILNW